MAWSHSQRHASHKQADCSVKGFKPNAIRYMATSTIVNSNIGNAQATGNTAVTLATSDKNITLSSVTGNGIAHLTSNGALSFDKAGKYLLIGDWGFSGLTSGNVLTVSIRKWDGSTTSALDSWGITVGGAYFSKTCAKIVDLSVGDALFMSARNNSSATGSFNFARLIAIELD